MSALYIKNKYKLMSALYIKNKYKRRRRNRKKAFQRNNQISKKQIIFYA